MELTETQAWEALDLFLALPEKIVIKGKPFLFRHHKIGKVYYIEYIDPLDTILLKSWGDTDFLRLLRKVIEDLIKFNILK